LLFGKAYIKLASKNEHKFGDTMNKNTTYIVVAVLVVVIVVGVAGYYLLANQGEQPSPTPTPPPAVPVSEATSIQFVVNETTTATGDLVIYEFACKDLNGATEVIRVDMDLGDAGSFSYIIDTGEQKSWMMMESEWYDSNFEEDCVTYGTLFHDFVDKLIAEGDDTTDVSYSTDDASYVITCIATNPERDDSLFSTD